MKIVLAFDSYKGSLSAPAACDAAAAGITRVPITPLDIRHCPLSDGGEGFADALCRAGRGTRRLVQVTGPLFAPTQAELVFLDDGRTAIIESAQACGLGLLPPAGSSPLHTTTYGVGELLRAAIAQGATRLIIGLGGSATNDAGLGMLAALGWQFLDAEGRTLPGTGVSLAQIARIVPGPALSPDVSIIAACDVENPLYGPQGAAHVFAPQKGATPEDVAMLDHGLVRFAMLSAETLGRDLAHHPGAGAAGGLGFALLAYLGATFQPGASLAIELSQLPVLLAQADLCLTGEGRTDGQTLFGKLPAAVIDCCVQAGVPVVCLSGALGDGWHDLYARGATAVLSISQRPQPLSEAIAHAERDLTDAAEAVVRLRALT
ncbi:MAG TPA: glycerate kinase [Armatimonadota bacterium]|jgi:glycerate kinase